eukprot:1161859-Pelagomonas_calceolata.AAC.1
MGSAISVAAHEQCIQHCSSWGSATGRSIMRALDQDSPEAIFFWTSVLPRQAKKTSGYSSHLLWTGLAKFRIKTL